MTDIVDRLRLYVEQDAHEAADEIERLRAEREADKALMRQALAAFDSMLGRKPEAVEKVVAALRERLGEKK